MKPLTIASLLLAAGMLLHEAPAHAQRTYTVKGQVFSLVDGLPLPDIRVALKGTTFAGVTDSTGTFRIRGVPPGTYDVIAKYPDFDATILRGVRVPPATQKAFVFNLEPAREVAPIPLKSVVDVPDSLGLLEGVIHVRIDTFRTSLERGHLVLKAVVKGNLLESYTYPQHWTLLPQEQQYMRFRFFVPVGQEYRLYLIWQEKKDDFLRERIVDVARDPRDAQRAATFDLRTRREIRNVDISFDANLIHEKS